MRGSQPPGSSFTPAVNDVPPLPQPDLVTTDHYKQIQVWLMEYQVAESVDHNRYWHLEGAEREVFYEHYKSARAERRSEVDRADCAIKRFARMASRIGLGANFEICSGVPLSVLQASQIYSRGIHTRRPVRCRPRGAGRPAARPGTRNTNDSSGGGDDPPDGESDPEPASRDSFAGVRAQSRTTHNKTHLTSIEVKAQLIQRDLEQGLGLSRLGGWPAVIRDQVCDLLIADGVLGDNAFGHLVFSDGGAS